MTREMIYLPPNFPAATEKSPDSIQLCSLISSTQDPNYAMDTLPPLDMSMYNMPIATLDAGSMGHIDDSSSSSSTNILVKAIELFSAQHEVGVPNFSKLLSAMEEIKNTRIQPERQLCQD